MRAAFRPHDPTASQSEWVGVASPTDEIPNQVMHIDLWLAPGIQIETSASLSATFPVASIRSVTRRSVI